MKMGKVIGRVTLSQAVPSLRGGRWLLVSPYTRTFMQQRHNQPKGLGTDPSPVVYDDMGAGVGDTIGYIEGREAAMPFKQPTPIDAYCGVIVDDVFYHP